MKITFQERTANCEVTIQFCQLGSCIITLKIWRVPYSCRNNDNVGWNLQQCPLTEVNAVFGGIAQLW